MTQVTDAISGVNAYLELNINLITPDPKDLSGAGNTIEPDEQTRDIATAYTFDGDYALFGIGKHSMVGVNVQIVYTETVTEPYGLMEAAYLAGEPVQFTWYPNGKVATNWMFDMNPAYITAFKRPPMDAGSATPIMASFSLQASEIKRTVYTV